MRLQRGFRAGASEKEDAAGQADLLDGREPGFDHLHLWREGQRVGVDGCIVAAGAGEAVGQAEGAAREGALFNFHPPASAIIRTLRGAGVVLPMA